MRFLGIWLSHSFVMAFSLVLAVLAMQAPAFTRDYAGTLLQVASDARRDIDQREVAARQFYGLTQEQDDDLVKALQAHEPSNAETLARSIDRARSLQMAHDEIAKSSPLLQPIIAFGSALDDRDGYKKPIWTLLLANYNLQLELSLASAIYGIAGLMLGSLIAQLALALFGRILPRRNAPRHRKEAFPLPS
jgi:hypothetical protein